MSRRASSSPRALRWYPAAADCIIPCRPVVRQGITSAMPYLIKTGSLTVVARSPSEALRLREQFLDDEGGDVMITDMDGFPVEPSELQQIVSQTGMDE